MRVGRSTAMAPIDTIAKYPSDYTLNTNINATCKVLDPNLMSWNKRSHKFSLRTKSLFLSDFVHKFVYIPVSEHFSFAKIIHPPDRCSISRSWLNSMIITHVYLVLGTIKGHSKMCSFVTQHNASEVLRECTIGMLTAGISTRDECWMFNVNFSTLSRLRTLF